MKDLDSITLLLPENIDSLMTPVVLAHLIMGDGNLKGGEGIILVCYINWICVEVKLDLIIRMFWTKFKAIILS